MAGKPGKSRAQQVRDAAVKKFADSPTPTITVATAAGEVEIGQVSYHERDGQDWVEVRTAGDNQGGEPHFRVVNPPTLAEDPFGDVEIGGRRYRDDPVTALAQLIGSFGGARTDKRRRR